MKKTNKELINDVLINEDLKRLFSIIIGDLTSPYIRILSDEEKKLISKDMLNYLFILRKTRYLSGEDFEKIMFLSTAISSVTGQKGDFGLIEDVLNMVFFANDTENIVPAIMDNMISEIWEYFNEEQIN